MSNRVVDSEVRSTTGMSKVEKLTVLLILAVLVAVAIPILLHLGAEAQLRTNRINLRDVRASAITTIQTGLGDTDSTGSGGRHINEGLRSGAGWVAVAQVDKNNDVTDMKIFVVDRVSDYRDGIAPGKVEHPVPAGADVPFYEPPVADLTGHPFATVKPTGNGSRVYTVQVVLDSSQIDNITS